MKPKRKLTMSDRVVILATGDTATIKGWSLVGGRIKARLELHNGGGIRHKDKTEIHRLENENT